MDKAVGLCIVMWLVVLGGTSVGVGIGWVDGAWMWVVGTVLVLYVGCIFALVWFLTSRGTARHRIRDDNGQLEQYND